MKVWVGLAVVLKLPSSKSHEYEFAPMVKLLKRTVNGEQPDVGNALTNGVMVFGLTNTC
jgi:hypothetical protein